jgi:hypothetical protein
VLGVGARGQVEDGVAQLFAYGVDGGGPYAAIKLEMVQEFKDGVDSLREGKERMTVSIYGEANFDIVQKAFFC